MLQYRDTLRKDDPRPRTCTLLLEAFVSGAVSNLYYRRLGEAQAEMQLSHTLNADWCRMHRKLICAPTFPLSLGARLPCTIDREHRSVCPYGLTNNYHLDGTNTMLCPVGRHHSFKFAGIWGDLLRGPAPLIRQGMSVECAILTKVDT